MMFFFLRAWGYKGAEQQNRCKTNTAEIIETATLLTKHLLAYNIWKHFLSAFTTLNVADMPNDSQYDCICACTWSKASAACRDGFSDGLLVGFI